MDYITIAGIEREVILTKHLIDKPVQMFNMYYAKQSKQAREEENKVI